ncbi:hypothetical protein QJS10_CPB04g01609 [Acorus calamus]|uniref:Glycoside hydrolase family 5 domain-containing protein n=1 Tax=Acorus calamus TaxID=4465 RepID=A0AAV9EYQ1_ACOCL|nr:hypothetical protein QJS10_CPB04g01609 [Acorus calamus]
MKLFLRLTIILLCTISLSTSQPLYTSGRWIIDGSGSRVKLSCVNWPSHLEPVLAEGLNKLPLDAISMKIMSMGFNCVRLTWPLFLAVNDSLASMTVRQSLRGLGLVESVAAVQVNNPGIVDLTLIQAYQAVVKSLGDNKVMVILDNHLSKPGWCCSNFDDNGFFGDKYFDPDVWVKGLTRMATLFNGSSNVVGMSLRNELRGPRQNVSLWYRYMQKGAEAVHAANPNVLVILSGLSFDNDLSFLASKQVQLSFTSKLVFEVHWYAFTDGQAWANNNPNQVCGTISGNIMRRAGFLLGQGWPLFLSEFGVDQRGTNLNDNRFLSCALGVIAELDMDWALWTLQGSYYLREGTIGLDETYGVLSWNWCASRNASFLQRISALQSPFQGPGISDELPYQILFHPATGLCVARKSLFEPLRLGPCADAEAWDYAPEKGTLALRGTHLCVQASELAKPAKFSLLCNDSSSRWLQTADSKMHLSSSLADNTTVCLDVDGADGTVVTNACKCLSGDRMCEAESQWFRIINSTRSRTDKNSCLELPAQGGWGVQ